MPYVSFGGPQYDGMPALEAPPAAPAQAVTFGSDVRLYRSTTKTLTLDDSGGGAANLVMSGGILYLGADGGTERIWKLAGNVIGTNAPITVNYNPGTNKISVGMSATVAAPGIDFGADVTMWREAAGTLSVIGFGADTVFKIRPRSVQAAVKPLVVRNPANTLDVFTVDVNGAVLGYTELSTNAGAKLSGSDLVLPATATYSRFFLAGQGYYRCDAADGAGQVAHSMETSITWNNATAQLFRLRNNGTDRFYVMAGGDAGIPTAGKGLKLTSPDGLTTKTLTINNAGAVTLL